MDFETYLDILPNEFRTVLSRLRLIILILKFVVMAVTELRDTNVLCLLCDKHDVEDEYHFVLICPIYLHYRKRFIMSYFFKRSSVHKFINAVPKQAYTYKSW